MAEIKTDKNASRALDQDQTNDAPSWIERIRLNRNDLKPSFSSQPLIKELKHDPMITPNLPCKLRYFSMM